MTSDTEVAYLIAVSRQPRSAEELNELERLLQSCEVQAVRSGAPLPLGGHLRGNGVNFAIFSRHATGVRLDLFDRAEDTAPARSIILDAARNKTGDIWHVWLEGIRPGQLYGFRVAGPYAPHDGHRFNPNKLVLDPCATAIVPVPDCDSRLAVGYDPSSPQKDLSFSDVDNAGSAPKCVITYEDFDWHGDQPLRLPWTSTVIYELHVRGYTIDPSAGVRSPGTYRGLIQKIPYLKDLGVTAVELMPVQEFNEHDSLRINPKTGERLRNFWGYDPVELLRAQGLLRQRPRGRRTGPGIQGDGPRVSPRGARGDPGRGLQPHRRRQRAGTDALASAASTTRSTTGSPTTSASTGTSPARDKPSTRAIPSCAISSSMRCGTG